GSAGAIFWIITPDPKRGYGVSYTTERDQKLLAQIKLASDNYSSLSSAETPSYIQDSSRHLVPRQFDWSRGPGTPGTLPQVISRDDKSVLYQFKPLTASAQRFEKYGNGPGYVWGSGSGFVEYTTPE